MKNLVGGEPLFRFGWKTVITILMAGIILIIGIKGTGRLSSRLAKEEMENLQKAVQRSIVQCYALEGQYPPSIAYLEEHYGLQIEKDKYLVDYNNFASNVMPQATVISLVGQTGGK